MMDYHKLNAMSPSIKSPVPNVIEITNSIISETDNIANIVLANTISQNNKNNTIFILCLC